MKKYLLLLLLLSVPTFINMLSFGVFTMHDPHLFRIHEFNLCLSTGSFPCRWSPNAGFGYGEPLFNFYAPGPFMLAQLFIWLGMSLISSFKATMIFSLLFSGVGMFFWSRRLWKNNLAALASSLFYIYAPYRAVDVWVRGALPEALALSLFPWIFWVLDAWIVSKKTKHLMLFSLLVSLLVITHNLSVFMILPFLGLYFLLRNQKLWIKSIISLISALFISILVSAFYILPVLGESRLITISQTTADYYFFANHFVSLKQLFTSSFWGYGGSVWGPNDNMSFSVGYLHWLLLPIVAIYVFFKENIRTKIFWLGLLILAGIAIVLTHGKSEFVWKAIPGMNFVQFPWRYLGIVALFTSVSVGIIGKINTKLFVLIAIILLAINLSHFQPGGWEHVTDSEYYSGKSFIDQTSTSLTDFWPTGYTVPNSHAPAQPDLETLKYGAHQVSYLVNKSDLSATQVINKVYFPGWKASVDGKAVEIFPQPKTGLIGVPMSTGLHTISLKFTDTPIRTAGNIVSAISILLVIIYLFRLNLYGKKKS